MTSEEAMDCLNGIKIYLQTEHIDTEALDMAIEALSAEPKRGEWIQKDLCADRFCSCCDYVVWDSEAEEYNYCPNCGAKMTKGGEDE